MAAPAIPRQARRLEWPALLLLVLPAVGLWAFVALAAEVGQGSTEAVDRSLLLALRDPLDPARPLGPHWLQEMMRDFTALGGIGVLTLLTLSAAFYLVLVGKWHAAITVLLSVGGGVLLSTLIKAGFDRPRPDLVPHGSLVATASFPSGHSMMAAVVYLTLGALLMRLRPQIGVKIFILAIAAFLTLLVGISRVYLGVHWPTDVLAGWAVGSAWALLCWLVTLWLQTYGTVEGDEA